MTTPWQRESQTAAWTELDDELRAAVERYRERYELGAPGQDELCCCVTTSEHTRRRGPLAWLLGVPKRRVSCMIVTRTHLYHAEAQAKGPALVAAYPLDELVRVQQAAPLPGDHGLRIEGRTLAHSRNEQFFAPLGRDGAGERFEQVLTEARAAARQRRQGG